MRKESCKVCNHVFPTYVHYVKTKENELLCENCFFDRALTELEATSHQNGFEDFEDEVSE